MKRASPLILVLPSLILAILILPHRALAQCYYPQKLGADLRVTSNASSSYDPFLVWTGSEFGLSWNDYRDGNFEIYFARVSSSGAKLGSDLRVTSNTSYSEYPFLAWTGSEFGVSWQDDRDGNYEIYFALVSAEGSKLGADLRVTSNPDFSYYPSLAWTESEFGVSWTDGRDGNPEIYFARVSASGAKFGTDLRVTSDSSNSLVPSLEWTGSEFGVSWQDDRDGNYEIYFARVSSDGSKLGDDLRVTSAASSSEWPSLAWTGSEFGVSWQDDRDGNSEIYFARVSSAGAKLGDDLRVTSNASGSYGPSLAWTGSEFGMGWQDYRDGNYEIYFARISSEGTKLGSDLRITFNASSSGSGSLAWTGSEFGVSWQDDRDGNPEIYFARIGCGNCNLTSLDIIPVASLAGGTMNLTEGAQQTFTAACTYSGSICGVLSDDCSQGGGVNWNYADQVSLSTPGPTTSTIATAGQIPGPNGGSGQVSGSASYGAGSFSDSTNIAVINNDMLSTVDVTPNTATIAEGGSQGFKAKATWSDGYTLQVACDAGTTWGLTGNLALGACASNTRTVTANQIPCIPGGSGTVNATYQGVSDASASMVTINNNDTISSVALTPAGPLNKQPGQTQDFYCVGTWNDGCTNSEANPQAAAPVYSLGQNHSAGSINSSTGLYTAGAAFPVIDSAVCTISGLSDSTTISVVCVGDTDCDGLPDSWENTYACMQANTVDRLSDYDFDSLNNAGEYINSTDPCNSDTDDDGMPDGWEVANIACVNPLVADANANPDGDEWINLEEYLLGHNPCSAEPATCPYLQKLGSDFRVTSDASSSYNPSLAWTGSEFGVSWRDDRDGNYEIYFARVSSEGPKLGADLRVTSDASSSYDPSLAWTGSEFGLSWQDDRDGNSEIYFARISSDGVKLGSDLRVTTNALISTNPSLAWTGSEFGVSWQDDRETGSYYPEIYFARISATGAKLGPDRQLTSWDLMLSVSPSLSWTGSEFGVSWQDTRNYGTYDIYFARISAAGSKNGSDLRVTSAAGVGVSPSLAWTGSEFGVSWTDTRDGNYEIYFVRLSSTGVKLGSDLRVTSDPNYSQVPSISWTGSEFGVSWNDGRDGNREIYFARVSSSGAKLGSDLRVTSNASGSYSPSLVWTGSEYGVSWYDGRDGNGEIYFARIGCGNCNLASLDIIPVASQAGGTINLAEGSQQTFTAACAYTGSTCGVLSDDCSQGQGVNWNYAGQVSLSTPGPSLSTIATAGQIPGPNGGVGQVSGSATYGARTFYDSTNITITNNDTLSTVQLTPLGPLDVNSGNTVNFYCVGSWDDGCTNSETNPQGTAPVYDLPTNGSGGSINSSTGLYTAGAVSPAIDLAVCTISGLSDGTTIAVIVCVGDADCDGLPDSWENTYACMLVNTPDNLEDYDSDGLNNEQEYANSTDPCDADTDNDGANDGLEVLTALTDPLDPDSDDDLMFDGWEIAGASCGLDPLDPEDAWLDSDTDTLANIHEYFNNNGDGNVSDPCDPDKPRQGWPGGGYFGDGDGNLLIGVPDLNRINLILNGRSADYSNAFPADPVIQDMDGNLIIGVPDKNLISLILNGKLSGIIAGSPTELSLVAPIGGATVSEGDTVRIQVKLTKDLTKPRAGFGVVFTIVSGAGTLLGGEGISGSGRYDLTALDGVAQLVVRVDGTESILVQVELPYDGEVHTRQVTMPDVPIEVLP